LSRSTKKNKQQPLQLSSLTKGRPDDDVAAAAGVAHGLTDRMMEGRRLLLRA
jgi:hypothetical protein